MTDDFVLKRTTTADPGFQELIALLDRELWEELKEDQATYDPFNNVENIQTAVLVYSGAEPVASGCFKVVGKDTVEIKRMFVQKNFRRKGLSKLVLNELEQWAIANGYTQAVLETSVHFTAACSLYKGFGYSLIPNYPPYTNLAESVCMKKTLQRG